MGKRIKQLMVDELVREFDGKKNLLVLDFQGTKAQEMNSIRASLGRSNVRLVVVKNAVASRAFEKTGEKRLCTFLTGPSAVAFGSSDVVELVKVITAAGRNMETVRIRGGIGDGQVLMREDVRRVAMLPSREVLTAHLVGGMAGPLRGFVSTTGGLLRKMVMLLQSVVEKRNKAAGEGMEEPDG